MRPLPPAELRALAAAAALQRHYAPERGVWADCWWQSANALEALIDCSRLIFLVLAARLQQRVASAAARQLYLDWAEREWRWFAAKGMINAQSLVNDGLDRQGHNNHGVTWTYNQGVILGGIVELHHANGDDEIVQLAQLIADAATGRLIYPEGVLREPCEEPALGRACDGDQELFKGIFVRYLAQLNGLVERSVYAEFIQRNADSLWQHGRGDGDVFGLRWTGPFDGESVQRQTAALDLFNAAMAQ